MANLSNINNYFVVDTTGKVAIGDVSAATMPTLLTQLTLYDNTATASLVIQSGAASGKKYELGSSSTGKFQITDLDAGLDRLTIAANGRVGIGTSNPVALLVLSQANGANIRFENSTTSRVFTIGEGVGTNDIFSFRGNSFRSTDTMSIDFMNNRVGINTISPTSKLDVRENANNVYTGYFYNSSTAANAHGINVQTATTNAGAYAFRVNSGSNSNALTVMGSGNVGIGTSTIPNPFSGAYSNVLQVGTTGGHTRLAITAGSTKSSDLNFADSNDATNVGSYAGGISYKHNGDFMLFSTNGTEKMRITSGGNVGIGRTTDTAKKLDVLGTGLRLQDNSNYSSITIGASGWQQDYPYQRLDTFSSDGTGYWWALGHKKTDGTKTVRMLISDTSTRYVSVIDNLYVQSFASNELGGSGNYPTFTTNIVFRNNGDSYINGGNVGIGNTNPKWALNTNLSIEGTSLAYLDGTSNNQTTTNNIGVSHNASGFGGSNGAQGGLFLANNNNASNAPSPIIFFGARSASNTYNHAYAAIYGIKTGGGADSNWNVGELTFATGQGTGPIRRMTINKDGNVGIGTNSPATKLHVENTNAAIVYVKSTVNNQNASIFFNSNSGGTQADRWEIGTNISAGSDLEFFDRLNSVSRMVIQNDGNVGIGTISPTAKLDIDGDVRYRGDTYSEFTYNGSGNYSNGTIYTVANTSQLTVNGIYQIVMYLSDYGAGGGTYMCWFCSVPFYWVTTGTNRTVSQTLPTLIGTGHAIGTIPTFYITQELGTQGAQAKVRFDPNNNWTGIDGSSSKKFQVYIKRLGG